MKTIDILKGARTILSDPKKWAKGNYVSINTDGDYCFCLLGACRHATAVTEGTTEGCETPSYAEIDEEEES